VPVQPQWWKKKTEALDPYNLSGHEQNHQTTQRQLLGLRDSKFL
jgi:hypothetical protein